MARAPQDDSASEDADPSDLDEEIPKLQLSQEDVRRILHRRFQEGSGSDGSDQDGAAGKGKGRKRKKMQLHGQFSRAVRRGSCLWTTPALTTSAADREGATLMPADAAKAHTQAKRQKKAEEDEELRPYAGKTAPRASLYPPAVDVEMDKWLESLQQAQLEGEDTKAQPRATRFPTACG